MTTSPFREAQRLLLAAGLTFFFGVHAAPAEADSLETPRRIELPPLPTQVTSISPDDLTRAGNRILFTAYDSRHGRELWQSDGSAAGTRRVADLCPGECSSKSYLENGYFVLGERVLFSARNGSGWMLYSLLGDRVEPVARIPGEMVEAQVFGDYLYVVVRRSYQDFRLFRSKGRPGSWELFENLCEEGVEIPYCREPELFVHRGELYYLHQGELRKTTTSGQITVLRQLSDAKGFVSLADRALLFQGCDRTPSGSCRLFVSDGTPAGTGPVSDGPLDALTADPAQLTYWNGAVYFTSGGGPIVRTDGTLSGTRRADELQQGDKSNTILAATPEALFYAPVDHQLVRSLRAHGADGADVGLITEPSLSLRVIGPLGDGLLIETGGSRFFLTDGTVAGSLFLTDWRSDALGSPGATLDGALYVAASHQAYSDQLWRFEPNGTMTRVDPASTGTFANWTPYPLGSRALVAASSASDGGLYRVDPETFAVTPIDGGRLDPQALSGSTLLALASSSPDHRSYFRITPETVEETAITEYQTMAPDGEGRFFFAGDQPGQKLMVTDGTVAGTRELFDFDPAWRTPPCSHHCLPKFPSSITVSGERLFLVAAAAPGSPELALWAYDGATGERRALIWPENYEPELIAFGRGKVAFQIRYGDNAGLWVSDGTVAGTRRVYTPPSYSQYRPPRFLAPNGERFYFSLNPELDRLWTSDGGPGGTYVLLDRDFLQLGESIAAGDQLFFVASDLEHGDELWVTDGTAAGTRLLEIRPGPEGSLPTALHTVGDRVVFAADDGEHGHELFVSDGSAAGTFLIADLAEGPTASSPSHLAAIGERIFFQADDGAIGRSLWAVDLPAAPLPPCPSDRLCLLGDRFEVAMEARVGATVFPGRRARSSAESGVFSFFGASNWEAMIKVLDGCAINQRFWVYAGAATDLPYEIRVKDRATGETRTWSSPGGRAEPILDGDAFATCGANPPEAAHVPVLPLGEPAPRCPDAPDAFCFGGGRFVARVAWQTQTAGGFAHTEPYGSRDSGLFTFFSPSNWELMVKVLDGCTLNGHHWVYLAGTTDVGWELTVEDRATGAVRRYRNPSGAASPAITDGEAFACH